MRSTISLRNHSGGGIRMNHYYTGVDDSVYLAHYGVLGMKWGQHLFGGSSSSSSRSSRSSYSKTASTKTTTSSTKNSSKSGKKSTSSRLLKGLAIAGGVTAAAAAAYVAADVVSEFALSSNLMAAVKGTSTKACPAYKLTIHKSNGDTTVIWRNEPKTNIFGQKISDSQKVMKTSTVLQRYS